MRFDGFPASFRPDTRPRLALAAAAVLSVFALALPAGASPGMSPVQGIAYFDVDDACDSAAEGADYAFILEGDLQGCLYSFVESYECRPSGTYVERGAEKFVGTGPDGDGSFETLYVFTGRYEDCENLAGQRWGRCQHPIQEDSGTGAFLGVDGRLDMRDDVEAGIADYRGHLRH